MQISAEKNDSIIHCVSKFESLDIHYQSFSSDTKHNDKHKIRQLQALTTHYILWPPCYIGCICIGLYNMYQFSSVQFSSIAQSCPTPCDPMNHSTPGLPVHHQLPEFTQTRVHRVGDAIQPSHSLLPLLLLPPIPPSIRVFANESTLCMRWPKYWSFSFSISPSNEHPGLIFRMDWLDPLQSKGLSRVFSNTTVQKHQFLGTQLSSQSNSHIHT